MKVSKQNHLRILRGLVNDEQFDKLIVEDVSYVSSARMREYVASATYQ